MTSSPPSAAPRPYPPAWVTLAALVAVSVASAAAMAPLAEAAYRTAAPELSSTVRTGLWVLGLAGPLIAVVKAAALAGVAWAVLILTNATPAFRPLWGTLLVGEVILAFQGLFVAAVLHLRGVGSIVSPDDLRLVTGLDLLFPDPTTALGAVALSVTPFHLAWLAFLAWRFAEAPGSGWGRGVLAAVACWLPGALIGLARTLGG